MFFLDDGLWAGRSFSLAEICSLQVHANFFKFGFLPNEEKCIWEPCQTQIVWLGTVINTADSILAATGKRVSSRLANINNLLGGNQRPIHVKRIAVVAGKIISLSKRGTGGL